MYCDIISLFIIIIPAIVGLVNVNVLRVASVTAKKVKCIPRKLFCREICHFKYVCRPRVVWDRAEFNGAFALYPTLLTWS